MFYKLFNLNLFYEYYDVFIEAGLTNEYMLLRCCSSNENLKYIEFLIEKGVDINYIETTAQSLGALLKSARDIMRKDKGLNGDLDRLPMLTWIMFLKFLDDLEIQREEETKLAGKKFKPAIEPPYRWRDWAAKSDGITGDELLAFINRKRWHCQMARKAPGLFATCAHLTSTDSAVHIPAGCHCHCVQRRA